jgi:hypothetical protein
MRDNKSDILTILHNIEALCDAYGRLYNSYAESSLLVTIMVETQTLSFKLRQMNRRWQTHLPFKEACDVDFLHWAGCIRQLSRRFHDAATLDKIHNELHGQPGNFLLDLYDQLPLRRDGQGKSIRKTEPYFQADSVKHYMERSENMRAAIAGNYADCVRSVSRHVVLESGSIPSDAIVSDDFWHVLEQNPASRQCGDALARLANDLKSLDKLLSSRIRREEFERLADRIFLEYGAESRENARSEVIQWQNSCPDDEMESDCQFQIDVAIDQLTNSEVGTKLHRYVKTNIDLQLQKANLGKFFFTFRNQLTLNDVSHIFYQHYLIQYYKEYQRDKVQEAINQVDDQPQATSFRLPPFFKETLYDNERALRQFILLLGQVEAKVNVSNAKTAQTDSYAMQSHKKYKWPHVMQALINLGFIPADTPKSDFARFIHSLFSNRTEDAVKRDLYRVPQKGFREIVKNIENKLLPVKKLLDEQAEK